MGRELKCEMWQIQSIFTLEISLKNIIIASHWLFHLRNSNHHGPGTSWELFTTLKCGEKIQSLVQKIRQKVQKIPQEVNRKYTVQ